MLDNNAPSTIFIEDMEIGMVRSRAKTITDRDIALFAEVSTDHNPVHLNEDYARETMFAGRIAHGMLTASLISAVVGEQLPGHGTGCQPLCGLGYFQHYTTAGFHGFCGRRYYFIARANGAVARHGLFAQRNYRLSLVAKFPY